MIKVVLGPNASMNFPKNLVEKIERAGRTVYPQGSSTPANVVAAGVVGGQASGGGQYIQTGEHQIPARFRKGAGDSSGADQAEKDQEAAARPNPNDFPMGGRRGIKAMGRRVIPAGEALVERDPSIPPPQVAKPHGFTSLAPRGSGNPPPPPPPADDAPPPESAPTEPPDDGGDAGAESDGTAQPD
jgi:hypothetical protein